MKKILLAGVFTILSIALFAQEKVTVEHQYPAFDTIMLSDYVHASLVPVEGYSVSITSDDRIADYIIAYVKDGVLNVSIDLKAMPSDVRKLFKAGTKSSDGIVGPDIEISLPKLSSLTVDGSSSVKSDSVISSDGKMSVILGKTASADGLAVKASGLYLELSQKASADMDADVKALNVQATNSAKAELKIHQAEEVKVNASSFANVEIYGTAKSVSLTTESSSKIIFKSALSE